MDGKFNPEKHATVSWVKIFTWRTNGDGINPHSNTFIEDCFIRTQDDSTYVNAGIKRVVYWQVSNQKIMRIYCNKAIVQDSNGATFLMNPIGNEEYDARGPHIIEDCTIVYTRTHWNHWPGAATFNMRGQGEGEGGYSVTFRNIVVEDPRPTNQHFKILMKGNLHGLSIINIFLNQEYSHG